MRSNEYNLLLSDMLALEKENMTPILNAHGIEFNEEEIVKDIEKSNYQLENVVYEYSQDEVLKGFVRFNIDQERNVIIKSLQINRRFNRAIVLKRLLKRLAEGVNKLDLAEDPIIYTWVNNSNGKAIGLHEKLGFKYVEGHRDAGKFAISKKVVLSRLGLFL